MTARATWWCQLAGWALFVVSAVLFLVGAWRSEDWIAVAASLAFLIACFVFLAPVLANRPST